MFYLLCVATLYMVCQYSHGHVHTSLTESVSHNTHCATYHLVIRDKFVWINHFAFNNVFT